MFVLDLFNTKFERELNEGAVDNLEARRIDDLNMRMLELLDRAKESHYKNNPKGLAGLKREFQKIKAERDSYFKINPATGMNDSGTLGTTKGKLDDSMGYGTLVGEGAMKKEMHKAAERMTLDQFVERYGDEDWIREFWNNINGPIDEGGIPGNVPTEKIPGKEDLLKGKGRSYYESQKKNSEQVDEYISMGSDKNFVEAEPYKNYRIYVRKKPFGNTGMYTAHTEIDRKEFMGKGSSQEEAVQAMRDRIDFVLNAQKKVTGSSTIDFNVKFATDLLADPRQTFYAKLENINGEPKLVIASPDVASDPELLAAGDFKRSALRNQVDDSGRATPLPGIPLTAKGLRSGDWIANGRYTVGKETSDRDGNRVFDLTYHSTAHTKSDKLRLNQPAFTLGTAREVDEQSNLENDDWYDDEEDQETELRSGDYVRDTMDGEHGEIFRMQGDPYERRVRILDRDGKGWYIEPGRLVAVDRNDPDIQRYFGKQRQRDMDEGWSDAMVARRTGQPRTPYSVYIKGRKWKDFENEDHAEAVANKLKAKFKADGRDPSVITIAPTDMSEGVGEEQLNEFLPVLAAVGGALARGVVGAGAAVGRGIASAGVRSKLASELDDEETNEEKTRLDPKCWTGKKIGNPKTKVKGGIRVNNCVPAESVEEEAKKGLYYYVNKRKKAGTSRDKDDPQAPTAQAWKDAARTAKKENVNEEQDSSGVERAILNRIMVAHTDLLMKFGPDKVMQAAEEVAYNVGDVDEIGTSDVSAYVAQVKQILGAV